MNIQHLDYANVSEPSAWNPNRNNGLLKSESTVSMKIGFPACEINTKSCIDTSRGP